MRVFKNSCRSFITLLSVLLSFESCKEDQLQDITKDNTEEVVSTYAGSTEGYEDGPGDQAKFLIANYLSADNMGNLYIGDYNRIRKINKDGIVSTLAGGKQPGPGETPVDGTGTNASFGAITGLAVSPNGMIYVSENVHVRRVSPEGEVVTERFSLYGYSGVLAIGPDSALYSLDMDIDITHYGQRIIKQTAEGVVIWRDEMLPFGYTGLAITVDHKGDVYLATGTSIYRLSETKIIRLAINPAIFGDGISSSLKINQTQELPDNYLPTDNVDLIDVADDGTIFFADNLKITRIAPDGTASILAGGTKGYVDGPASQARFEQIYAIELAENDKVLYVSDAYKIRRITLK